MHSYADVDDRGGLAGLPPLACTGARARRLTRRLTAFYEQQMRATGLRLGQYSLLMHLSDAPQTVSELADRLEMDRTTLSRSLAPLVGRGWVLTQSGRDARQRLLALSPEGELCRREAQRYWQEAQRALEQHLGRDFVAKLNHTLEDALARLKPALTEDNG